VRRLEEAVSREFEICYGRWHRPPEFN
jgi:hypothetical protein